MGVFLSRIRSDLARHWIEFTAIAGFLLYFLVSKSLPDVPLCPSHYLGHPCPTCGTTRSLWNILHGNFGTAWTFNPIGYVVLLVLCRRMLVLSLMSRSLNRLMESKAADMTLLGAFLAFGFLRAVGLL